MEETKKELTQMDLAVLFYEREQRERKEKNRAKMARYKELWKTEGFKCEYCLNTLFKIDRQKHIYYCKRNKQPKNKQK